MNKIRQGGTSPLRRAITGKLHGNLNTSEDCLFLNIAAAADAINKVSWNSQWIKRQAFDLTLSTDR